jgi:hypothetical protein
MTWKCHNETLCIDVLNKPKMSFFFCLKKGRQEGKADPAWGLVIVGGERI